ncbi:MAG: SprB repeat-containing protein [Ginsengibacter sp.]
MEFKTKMRQVIKVINFSGYYRRGRRLPLLIIILTSSAKVFGQVTVYSQNFGTGNSFPAGWSGTTWTINNSSNSTGYPGASGGSNAAFINSSASGTLTFSNNLSTIGYSNITVIWGARLFTGFPGTTVFQWSPDGTNWNTQAFTNVASNTTWALINGGTAVTLPASAAASNLSFRLVITGAGTGSNTSYRIDDFVVEGCQTPTAYTVTGGGSYCSGGTVPVVGGSNSETGVNYQLKINGVNTGSPIAGTGSAISFGNQATSGTYTIEATRTNGGCVNTMTGSVVVSAFPIPGASVSSKTNITCFGANDGAITVSASSGTSPYTFSVDGTNFFAQTSPNTRVFTGLLPNIPYQIKVKDNNGCISK